MVDRGHLGNQEDVATLRQIPLLFTAYQYSLFTDWDDLNHRPAQTVGYRKKPKIGDDDGILFYIFPEGWREINKGRDYKKATIPILITGCLHT